MNDESDGLAGSLAELASEARRRQGPDSHPSPETLTAYHAGELTAAAAEDVQEHLTVCRHCARLVLDLPAFLEAPTAAAEIERPDEEAEAAWRQIRPRLPGPPHPPDPLAPPHPPDPPDPPDTAGRRREPLRVRSMGPRQAWPGLAVAAMIAGAALIAVPLWIIARQLSSPELPPATLELSTPEGQRGAAEPPPVPTARVHAQAASTTLLLRLARPQTDLRFRVELLAGGVTGAAGAPASRPLPPPPVTIVDSRNLVLVLARRQLAPGTYQLRILDTEQPSAEPLGDFSFQVVEP